MRMSVLEKTENEIRLALRRHICDPDRHSTQLKPEESTFSLLISFFVFAKTCFHLSH